jgi:peptide/nickel transport system permease protein
MHLGTEVELTTPEKAVLFWSRFWADRSVDFTEPSVRRSVRRLLERNSNMLEKDLQMVDTFALQPIVAALETHLDRPRLERLTRVLAHVTGRGGIIEEASDPGEARAIVSDWLSWWFVHESDYVVLEGGSKLAASLGQTRYAKWMLGAVTGRLGLSTRDGLPIFDKLVLRAPITLSIASLALLLSILLGVPIGVLAAWRRGSGIAFVTAGFIVLIHAIPTFLIGEVLAVLRGNTGTYALPILALSMGSLPLVMQQQRSSMLKALDEDYVRAVRAKGARTLRVVVVHALRNALMPTVSLAGVQLPALVGGSFVIEEVFDIRGLGWETLRAIESRDVAWVVVVTLVCALATTACLVASDIAYGLLDPRVREQQTRSLAA